MEEEEEHGGVRTRWIMGKREQSPFGRRLVSEHWMYGAASRGNRLVLSMRLNVRNISDLFLTGVMSQRAVIGPQNIDTGFFLYTNLEARNLETN